MYRHGIRPFRLPGVRKRVHKCVGRCRISSIISDYLHFFHNIVCSTDSKHRHNHPPGSEPNEIPLTTLPCHIHDKPGNADYILTPLGCNRMCRSHRRSPSCRAMDCNEHYYAKSQRLNIARFWHEIGKIMVIPVIFTTSYPHMSFCRLYNDLPPHFGECFCFQLCISLLFWKFSMNQDERGCTLAAPCKRPRLHASRSIRYPYLT